MIDIANELKAIHRAVSTRSQADGDVVSVVLRRTYDAVIEDVWDALTNPERIGRWFLPISGDYRVGGRYQFEGNAGGEIVSCKRPNRLRLATLLSRAGHRGQGHRRLPIRLMAPRHSTTVMFTFSTHSG